MVDGMVAGEVVMADFAAATVTVTVTTMIGADVMNRTVGKLDGRCRPPLLTPMALTLFMFAV